MGEYSELTRQEGVATLRGMIRRQLPTMPPDPFDDFADGPTVAGIEDARSAGVGQPSKGADRWFSSADLSALPIAGLTQRRVALLLGALIAAWIMVLFVRQVGDAAAATARAETMITDNAARHAEIAGLERELDRIQQRRFILQQARAYGLGGHNEIAFTLDPDAPALPALAPGSAALRIGAPAVVTPLESWLNLLFGPGQ